MPQKTNIQASETSAQAVGHNSPKKYSIWQKDSRKIWLALALLIAGLVLTCIVALYEKRGVESIARKEFDFACNEIKSRILTRIEQHAQILRSGSAVFEINENITREQWHNFIARQNIELALPGIQGIGYRPYSHAVQLFSGFTTNAIHFFHWKWPEFHWNIMFP